MNNVFSMALSVYYADPLGFTHALTGIDTFLRLQTNIDTDALYL
jgi:hypothetical protein